MKKLSATALACLLWVGNAYAEAPKRLHVEESVQLNVPADKVWALVGDFSALNQWHPAIQGLYMNTPVSRVLDLGDGKRLLEELESKDDAGMHLSYRIASMTTVGSIEVDGKQVEQKVLPVNTYSSTISVIPEGAVSKVVWSGDFYRAWLADSTPPAGMGDEDAVNTIKAVYRAGLDNLPKVLGGNAEATPAAQEPAQAPAEAVAPAEPVQAAQPAVQAVEQAAPAEQAAQPAVQAVEQAAPAQPAEQAATPAAAQEQQASTGNTYDGHVKCEGGACKIDQFLTKGFRTFSQCQVCHGIDGSGSTIAPNLMEKIKQLDHATFVERVAKGYTGQIGVMPAWGENPNVMNNIENLYSYLQARADDVIPAGPIPKY